MYGVYNRRASGSDVLRVPPVPYGNVPLVQTHNERVQRVHVPRNAAGNAEWPLRELSRAIMVLKNDSAFSRTNFATTANLA